MFKKPKLAAKISLAIFLAAQFYGLAFLFPKKLDSAQLTSVSDTISNSRLSFRGELSGAVAAGSAVITLKTSGLGTNNTSTGSGTLMTNDGIRVGSGTGATITTVKTLESDTRVVLAAGLSNAASDGDPVISTVSAIHTFRFTPYSQIANGAFRVLIPAASDSETGDGLPDKNGFDVVTGSLPTVACSGGGSNITFADSGTGTATRSGVTVGGTNYHSFECRYTGSGQSATQVTMIIGTAAGNKIINPSPSGYSASHGPGAGDTYTFRTRHLYGVDQSYATVDETLGKVSVIEAVRVTATVAPTLVFMLTGVTASQSVCGQTTDVATTPNTVPLGTVLSTDFSDAAQVLSVSTNAVGGYSVTASESAALTAWSLSGSPTIADTTCGGTCTVTTTGDWTSTTNKGFGYALANKTGTPVPSAIRYNTGGTFMARPFGVTAQQIMTASAPVDLDQAYVCYRAIVSGTQAAGDYENYVIYIATATF
ncbi:MAG: hypothetical protein ACOZBZ_04625 [Patescibacteria group bacterium]